MAHAQPPAPRQETDRDEEGEDRNEREMRHDVRLLAVHAHGVDVCARLQQPGKQDEHRKAKQGRPRYDVSMTSFARSMQCCLAQLRLI